MADQPRRPRTLNDARTEAERRSSAPPPRCGSAAEKRQRFPALRELVSLRIDQDVLEYFQEGGPGWQGPHQRRRCERAAANRSPRARILILRSAE